MSDTSLSLPLPLASSDPLNHSSSPRQHHQSSLAENMLNSSSSPSSYNSSSSSSSSSSSTSPSPSPPPHPHSLSTGNDYAPITAPINTFTGREEPQSDHMITLPLATSSSSSSSSFHLSDDNLMDDENDSSALPPPSSSSSILSSSPSPLHLSDSSSILSFLSLDMNTLPIRFYYIVLFFSLLAVSCAGSLLRSLSSTPPFLKSFWRLFNLSLFLLVGFLYQIRHVDPFFKAKYWSRPTWTILLIGGMAQGLHFATWIWSLDHTSLSHSLFFVCFHPIIIVIILLIQRVKLNRFEWVGILIGFAGSVFLFLDVSNPSYVTITTNNEDGSTTTQSVLDQQNSPSFLGDFVAFLGAIFMVIYLYGGKTLRSWMPLFLYAFPITAISCIPVLFLSIVSEDMTFFGLNNNSLFGFLSSSNFPYLFLIVIGPGIIGHTGINLSLSRVSPLSVSILLTLEPILGTLIGVAVGVSAVPGLFTFIGGPLAVIGCIGAIWGTHQRQKEDAAEVENINSWMGEEEKLHLSLSEEGAEGGSGRNHLMDSEDEEDLNDDAGGEGEENDIERNPISHDDHDDDDDEDSLFANSTKNGYKKVTESGKKNHKNKNSNSSLASATDKKKLIKKGNVSSESNPIHSSSSSSSSSSSYSGKYQPRLVVPPPKIINAIELIPRMPSSQQYSIVHPSSSAEANRAKTHHPHRETLPYDAMDTELDDVGDPYVSNKIKVLAEREKISHEERKREEEIIRIAEISNELYEENIRAKDTINKMNMENEERKKQIKENQMVREKEAKEWQSKALKEEERYTGNKRKGKGGGVVPPGHERQKEDPIVAQAEANAKKFQVMEEDEEGML